MLKAFYKDEHMRKAVEAFVIEYLREKAAELAFNGESTDHIKTAKEVINEAWNKLEMLYGEKKGQKLNNPAR